jgi:CIC family chloride channel protein
MTHHKDQAVLTLLKMEHIIETDFIKVTPDMSLGEIVKEAIARSSRSMFPVVGKHDRLIGIVQVDNIRNIMFRPELYGRFYVSRFMVSPPAQIVTDMPMEKIMKIFDDTKAWNLPVVDREGHYLGFVSKSKIFNAYREVLVDTFSGD